MGTLRGTRIPAHRGSEDVIHALWTGDHVHIQGEFWDVDGRLYDPPASPIPLYIAAGGPKSARLAGLHGDGLIAGAKVLRSGPGLRASWEKGVREAGKDPAGQPVVVEHWAMVGGEEEAREAAEKWRFAPKAWKSGYFDNISPVEIQAHAEKEIPLERVLQDWTISKDPKVHRDRDTGARQPGRDPRRRPHRCGGPAESHRLFRS